jgi:hypothetical protein
MIRRTTSLALAAIFLVGCSSTPKTRGVSQNSDTFWSVASRHVDQEGVDLESARKAAEGCLKFDTLPDRDACVRNAYQVGFISKAVYPEMAQAFIDDYVHMLRAYWQHQLTDEQGHYIANRLVQEYTLKRNNALYARMDSMQARESAGGSRWAEIAAGAATSIGTAAAFSQPQFTDVPPIIRQPYWMYQGNQYQDPRRDEYHMHPGVKW